jgi:hypothetical protein
VTETKAWSDLMVQWADLLQRRTGGSVAEWNERVRASGADQDEVHLREWLTEQGVTGYMQQLLVMERFGYPAFLTATADDLIAAQYADRAQLRPILDGLLAAASALGAITIQARKGYVSLVSPRRTFAVVRPTTKQRVDLGLRLSGQEPGGRVETARGLGNDRITLRVGLRSVEDIDDEVVELLREAYAENAEIPAHGRSHRSGRGEPVQPHT